LIVFFAAIREILKRQIYGCNKQILRSGFRASANRIPRGNEFGRFAFLLDRTRKIACYLDTNFAEKKLGKATQSLSATPTIIPQPLPSCPRQSIPTRRPAKSNWLNKIAAIT
jgi:hypothetical protein